MEITNQGNVGIGTTSPAALLEYYGTSGTLLQVHDGVTRSLVSILSELLLLMVQLERMAVL